MAINTPSPPPSKVDLVKEDLKADSIWKKWINTFYEWSVDNMSKDFFFEVRQGNINGYSSVHKFGTKAALTTSFLHVWNNPADTDLVFQQVAAKYDVYSSSANDTSGGSGTGTVTLECLDANFNEVTEIVTLNGATAVATTGSYIRCQRGKAKSPGVYGAKNAGDIRVEVTSAGAKTGDLQAFIETGKGSTEKTQFTVPNGKEAYIKRIGITMDTGKVVNVELNVRLDADVTTAPFGATFITHHWDGLDSPVDDETFAGDPIPEKSDIYFAGNVPSTSATIDIGYDIILRYI